MNSKKYEENGKRTRFGFANDLILPNPVFHIILGDELLVQIKKCELMI